MQKEHWPDFLASRIRSQVAIENAQKAQNWALGLLSILALSFALSAIGSSDLRETLYPTKILFLTLAHLLVLLAFYLPHLLQKGDRPLAHLLGIRDFTALFTMGLVLTFYAVILCMISWQGVKGLGEGSRSQFFGFILWTNFLGSLMNLFFAAFCFTAILFFPHALVKLAERGSKWLWAGLGVHALFLTFFLFGYAEMAPLGSTEFFTQFRVTALFWTFIASSVLLVSRLFRSSSLNALTALELEVAAGRLERSEDILVRLKDAFVAKRFDRWTRRISVGVAEKAHQIAAHTHQVVTLVNREIPTELDLRQVEDQYRRAEVVYRRLEKDNQRFVVCLSLFDLSEVEQERSEAVKDQFSRELRNAKLELAQVRKRIDEKLVALRTVPPAAVPTRSEDVKIPVVESPVAR